jgi:hypothetical protein
MAIEHLRHLHRRKAVRLCVYRPSSVIVFENVPRRRPVDPFGAVLHATLVLAFFSLSPDFVESLGKNLVNNPSRHSSRLPSPQGHQKAFLPAPFISIAEASPNACRLSQSLQRRSVHPREQPTPLVVQTPLHPRWCHHHARPFS